MRSRNLKPGFFTNEDLAECTPWARLCFAGLWLLADREGRLEDRPKRIRGELFRFDNVDIEELLGELEGRGFIVRYQIERERFIQVAAFKKHQTPHYSEKPSVIMPPPFLESSGDDDERDPRGIPDGSMHDPGVDPPLRGGRNPLIPDSLIPDSLIPEKESAQSVPKHSARAQDEGKPEISPAGAACLAMRKAGMAATNPGDPRLLELLRQGATVEEFSGAAADAVKAGKGWAWALKALEGRRADAAKIALAPAAPPPPWPSVWSEVVRRGAAVGMPWSELTPEGRAASREHYRTAVVAAWSQQKGANA